MKRLLCITIGLLIVGQFSGLLAQVAAPGATLTRDVWGDTWYPEWNTDGDPAFQEGYRNTVAADPHPGTWSAVGKQLTVVKDIEGLGEGRWNKSSVLVFAEDGSGQWVRFGAWVSSGEGKGGNQTINFTIPSWATGEIKWEVWAWYGAASNISNNQYNPLSKRWVDHLTKSHLAVAYGDTGINIANIRPKSPLVNTAQSAPSGSISPSIASVDLGSSVDFSLSTSGADRPNITFVGNSANVTNPPATVSVVPTVLGPQTYTLNVPGTASISWGDPEIGDSLKLITPSGISVDVTSRRSYTVTGGNAGRYQLVESTSTGIPSDPMNVDVTLPTVFTTTATITVNASAASVSVTPQSATYTVSSGLAAGHTYPRSWSDGSGWHAYLGRDGVLINVSASSTVSGISQMELQAKTPTGDWSDLVPAQAVDPSLPNGAGVTVSQAFSVKLGADQANQPLIPADSSLAGTWQLRARALTSSGQWSGWSPGTPISVEMPIATVTKTGQTLPPVEDAAWYTASQVKTYTFKVWIP